MVVKYVHISDGSGVSGPATPEISEKNAGHSSNQIRVRNKGHF